MNYTIPLLVSAMFLTNAPANLLRSEKSDVLYEGNVPAQADHSRIRAVEFKAQQYCRAELKDFEFDARFTVLSATVYFSGANFSDTKTGYITSNSLKEIQTLKDKCIPGSIVLFDNIKVKGPDGEVRTIGSVSYLLY